MKDFLQEYSIFIITVILLLSLFVYTLFKGNCITANINDLLNVKQEQTVKQSNISSDNNFKKYIIDQDELNYLEGGSKYEEFNK